MDRRGTSSHKRPQFRDPELLAQLLASDRPNAIIAWILAGVLVLVLAESVLDLDWQWIVFVTATGVIILLPPVAYRDWRVMLPWELLVLSLLPILVRGLFGGTTGIFASYVAVAGLALIVVVELDRFTSLEVTHWFAVSLVVLTTLASVAVWSILRWIFDILLGAGYLTTNDALMIEFIWVTLAGFAAGVLFDVYFRRRESLLQRTIRWVLSR